MPTRVLREGILSSSRINALSPLAELFYRRLMTVADDYGRYYASPATIRGACWPTCPDKVTEKQISAWLDECSSGDDPLIIRYSASGNHYIQVQNFGQQTRSKSKFPEPTENNTLIIRKSLDNQSSINCVSPDNQMCSLVGVGVVDECVVGDGRAAPKSGAVTDDWFESQFWPSWVKAKNDSKGAALKAFRAKVKTSDVLGLVLAAVESQKSGRVNQEPQFRSHAATWLNQSRWMDATEPEIDPELLDYRNQPWKPDW